MNFCNGSCSLASHIALEEAGAKFEAQRINLREQEQKRPEYLAVNPKGKVPALVVDGGHHREPGDHQLRRRYAIRRRTAGRAGRRSSAPRRRSGWRGAPRRCTVVRAALPRSRTTPSRRSSCSRTSITTTSGSRAPTCSARPSRRRLLHAGVHAVGRQVRASRVGPKMRASAKALLQRPAVQRAVTTQQLKFEHL